MAADRSGRPAAIVVVHGVGATIPGAFLRDLVGEIAGPIKTGEEVAACSSAKLSGDKDFTAAYEVYWADLKPGGDSLPARFLRLFDVLIGLSRIGGTGWKGEPTGVNASSFFGHVLHIVLWGVAIALPCIWLPLLHFATMKSGFLAALLSVTPTLFLAAYLGKHEKWCWLALALGLAAASVICLLGATTEISLEAGARLSGKLNTAIQLVVVLLIILAAVEIGVKTWLSPCKPAFGPALVRFASLSLPFTILGGIGGSLTWAVNLSVVANWGDARRFDDWSRFYTDSLSYDLPLLELLFALATLLFLLVIAGVFTAFLAQLRSVSDSVNDLPRPASPPLGARARDGLLVSFVVLAAGSLFVATIFILNVTVFPQEDILELWPMGAAQSAFLALAGAFVGDQPEIFRVYAASASRVVGLLPWLLGPFRRGAALAADVVLYLVDDERLGYGAQARERLNELLEAIEPDRAVHLVSHSQGTVIVVDTLNEFPRSLASLITAGSPIETLYRRFLSVDFAKPNSSCLWHNFYRATDYIGGPVDAADVNVELTEFLRENHINYFRDPEVLSTLRNAAGRPD